MKLLKLGDKKEGTSTLQFGLRTGWIIMVMTVAMVTRATFAAEKEASKQEVSSKKEENGYVIEKRGDKTIKYKKKTTYDFEGANIEGLYNKPSGSYISNIKDVKAKSIIRIRENFDNEVIDSVRSLK